MDYLQLNTAVIILMIYINTKAKISEAHQPESKNNFTREPSLQPFQFISLDEDGEVIVMAYAAPNMKADITNFKCQHSYSLFDGQSLQFRSPDNISSFNYMSSLTCFTSPHGTRILLTCEDIHVDCETYRFEIGQNGHLNRSSSILCGFETFQETSEDNSIVILFETKWNGNALSRADAPSPEFKCQISVIGNTQRMARLDSFPINTTLHSNHSRVVRSTKSTGCECGRRNSLKEEHKRRKPRHTIAEPNEFPWRCYLYACDGSMCGCSVISNRWVLTAAHCTHKNKKALVILGAHERGPEIDVNVVVRKSCRIINHPEFDSDELFNDIALVKLERKIDFNAKIAPVCLPWNMLNEDFTGKRVITSGWGTTSSTRQGSSILRKLKLSVINLRYCAYIYRRYGVSTDMICAHKRGKGVKDGDSGGSLDFERKGRYYAIGVTSWLSGKKPSVFARVTHFLSWIQKTTGESFCKA